MQEEGLDRQGRAIEGPMTVKLAKEEAYDDDAAV